MAVLRMALTLLVGLGIWSSGARAEPPEDKPGRRTDQYGDTLPEGAIARLGTVRLRHTELVLSLAYSPDGKLIASGGRDNVICLWDANTGREVRRLTAPDHWFDQIAFSPDGMLLAAVNHYDEIIQLWSISDGKQVFKLKGICAAFTPDGKSLATGGKDKLIRFWDPSKGKEVRRLAGHEKEVRSLAFSPDGAMLASGSGDETVRIWNVATGKSIQKIGPFQNEVRSIAFALAGKRLGLTANGRFHLYDTAMDEQVRKIGTAKEEVRDVLSSPNGTEFATTGRCRVQFWDAATGKMLRSISSKSWDFYESVDSLAISPDGRQLACAVFESTICRFDLTTSEELLFPQAHQKPIHDIAVAPDGKTIATASGDRTVRRWETLTGKELRVLRGHKYGVYSVAFSPDGRMLASSGQDEKVILWDNTTGKELRRMQGMSVAFSPDGKILAAGGRIGGGRSSDTAWIIRIYDAATGNELQRLSGHHRRITDVVFSPDGWLLASIEYRPILGMGFNPPKPEPSSIRLWDVASGKEWLNFGHGRAEGPLAFSADGKTLVSASPDNDRLLFWEVATEKERRQIHCKPNSAWHVAFAADGQTFATAGEERTIRLHAWPTGQELGQFEGRTGSVWALTYTPDGAALVSGGLDTTATVWDLNGLKRPALQSSRELSREEFQELWADLGRDDAARAFRAVGSLAAARGRAEAYLKEQLVLAHIDRERITKLIADLDNEQYETREAAGRALAELGSVTMPFLQKALKAPTSTEARRRLERLLTMAVKGPLPLTQVQQLRTLEVLELLGTREARQVLEPLAKGDPEARLTQEATSALDRLGKLLAK
jgi:WD40 repeat protein